MDGCLTQMAIDLVFDGRAHEVRHGSLEVIRLKHARGGPGHHAWPRLKCC